MVFENEGVGGSHPEGEKRLQLLTPDTDGTSLLSNLSGLAFHTFAKDIFNKAQRDFYLEFYSCVQQRKYANFPSCVCTYEHMGVELTLPQSPDL